VTFGQLGWQGRRRWTAVLGVSAVALWTEPVLRSVQVGQIELLLMALIAWDMCQPEHRKWKGVGIGVAAGIKLVPLIFIPYLILAGKLRQAAVATAVFAATVVVGFVALPHESVKWWLTGYFLHAGNFSNTSLGSLLNQSMLALLERTPAGAGSVTAVWVLFAAVIGCLGLAAAALLARSGRPTAGWVTCALTGVLISPISWDHHWVWIVPAVAVAAHYAVRARSVVARWASASLAAGITLVFGAWPKSLWSVPSKRPGFAEGFIWAPPNTNPSLYYHYGDRPSYVEYHWHGLYLIAGNLYVLAGMALFVMLLVFAARAVWGAQGTQAARTALATAADGPAVSSASG